MATTYLRKAHDLRADVAGTEAQARQTFANIKTVLDGVGLTKLDLVKINVYLTSHDDLGAYRAARDEALGDVETASTLVVVKALANPDMSVEIEAVAASVDSVLTALLCFVPSRTSVWRSLSRSRQIWYSTRLPRQ